MNLLKIKLHLIVCQTIMLTIIQQFAIYYRNVKAKFWIDLIILEIQKNIKISIYYYPSTVISNFYHKKYYTDLILFYFCRNLLILNFRSVELIFVKISNFNSTKEITTCQEIITYYKLLHLTNKMVKERFEVM